MTQLSRIVDLYVNYDSIVLVTEVYYRRKESWRFILVMMYDGRREQVTIIKFCNRGWLQREESR